MQPSLSKYIFKIKNDFQEFHSVKSVKINEIFSRVIKADMSVGVDLKLLAFQKFSIAVKDWIIGKNRLREFFIMTDFLNFIILKIAWQ